MLRKFFLLQTFIPSFIGCIGTYIIMLRITEYSAKNPNASRFLIEHENMTSWYPLKLGLAITAFFLIISGLHYLFSRFNKDATT